jgi:nucleoside-diphosphate-sugar epimerase
MTDTVLIIGGSGFIGSQLCQYFVDDGFKTYSLDMNIQYFFPLTPKNIFNMNYRHSTLLNGVVFLRGSSLDVNDLRRTILDVRPDYVINLGALPLAQKAVHNSEEAFDSILASTKNILEVLRDVDFVKNYVHISSSMVYGDFETIPVKVDAKKSPIEIYGSMKLASEFIVKGYAQRHKIPYSIIRPSAVYGPTDNNRRVLQIFIENAMEGKKIIANNPSKNMMDFTFIEDIASGIKSVALSHKAIGQEFNVTRGEGRSLSKAMDIIKSYFPNAEFHINEDIESIYPKRGSLDITKTHNLTGYTPKYSLEAGIEKYISFIRKGNAS